MTWFDDEMEALTSTAHQLGMPVTVHTGAAEGCKQAIRWGARSLEHAYLIDAEGIERQSGPEPISCPRCR
jgi:tryptophan 2-monooxygenase